MKETLHVTEYSSGGKTELTINEGYSPYDDEWWALEGAGRINISKDELDALCLWWLAKHPELVKPSLTEEERTHVNNAMEFIKAAMPLLSANAMLDAHNINQGLQRLLERTK
jgi:hypothetical protein